VFAAVHQHVRELMGDDNGQVARVLYHPHRVHQFRPSAAVAAADGLGVEGRILLRGVDKENRRPPGFQHTREFARVRRSKDAIARIHVGAQHLDRDGRDAALGKNAGGLRRRGTHLRFLPGAAGKIDEREQESEQAWHLRNRPGFV
jgi:hypothetical protein